MTDSAIVKFALNASTIALTAKCGTLGLRARLGLAIEVLSLPAEEETARLAVLEFLTLFEGDCVAAGEFLQDQAAAILAQHPVVEAGETPEFDWQQRADLK